MLKVIKSRLMPAFLLKVKEKQLISVLTEGNYQNIQEILNKGALRSPHISDKFSPFPIILPKNDIKLIKLLTKYGASLKEFNQKGENLLHLSCYKSGLEVFKYLLKKNFSLSTKDSNGLLPIHKAATAGNLSIVKEIISRLPEQINNNDNSFLLTPLHCAVKSCSLPTVKYFLEHGADKNSISSEGTPFFLAACFSTIEIAEKLLNENADYTIGNNHEAPVISLTRFARNKVLFKILELSENQLFEKDKETNDNLLHIAIKNSNIDAIKKFIELGINVNENNGKDISPMKMALDNNDIEAINILLEAGYIPLQTEKEKLEKITGL